MKGYIDKRKLWFTVISKYDEGLSVEELHDVLEAIPSVDIVERERYESMERTVRHLSFTITKMGCDLRDCRNELCLRCGEYKTKHLGSCDDCRWKDM